MSYWIIISLIAASNILPSWFATTIKDDCIYVAGVGPRYYSVESSYREARESAVDELNMMSYFSVKGERGWLSDKDYTVYAGSDMQIEWDSSFSYEDSSIIPVDSIILDSFAYYLVKTDYPYKLPYVEPGWWNKLPSIDGWYLAVGSFTKPYIPAEGWIYSAQRARLNLAEYSVKVSSLEKKSIDDMQNVTVEKINVVLKNSIILKRHREKGTYHTLVGIPIQCIKYREDKIME